MVLAQQPLADTLEAQAKDFSRYYKGKISIVYGMN
jgi:hypothetical protein